MRALLAVLLLVPSLALADVVRGPECPPGSRLSAKHGSAGTCVLDGCTSDAECGAGHVCKEVPLCVNSGVVTAACGSGNVCSIGTCSKDKRCIADTKGNKCGCSAGSPGESVLYLGVAALLVTFRTAAWGRRRAKQTPP
jgi:hypothetical protein